MTKDSDFNDDDFLEGELEGLSDDLQTLDESPVSYPPTVQPIHSAATDQPVGGAEDVDDDFFDSFDDAAGKNAPEEQSKESAADEDGFLDAFEGFESASAPSHAPDPLSDPSQSAPAQEDASAVPARESGIAQSQDVPTLKVDSSEYAEPQVISFEDDDPAEAVVVDVQDADDEIGLGIDDLEEDKGRGAKSSGMSTTKIALIAAPVILLVVLFGVFVKYQQIMGKQGAQPQSPSVAFVPAEPVAQDPRPPAKVAQQQAQLANEAPSSASAQSDRGDVSDLFAPVAPVDEVAPAKPTPQATQQDASPARQEAQEQPQQGAFSSSFYDRLGDPRVQFNSAKVTVEPGGQDVTVKRSVAAEGSIPARPSTAVETVDEGLGGAREWLREQFSAVREDMVAINSKLDLAAAERAQLRDGLDGLARRVTALENPDSGRGKAPSVNASANNDEAGKMRIIGLIHGKAWVVIGNEVVTRTIQPGDVVPGFGRVKEIRDDACGVSFEGGQRVCIE